MAGCDTDPRGLEHRHALAPSGLRARLQRPAGGRRSHRAGRTRVARLTIVGDKAAMSDTAAERIAALLQAAVAQRGLAAMSLTGGDTPDLLYERLADDKRPWRRRIDWQRLHLFWGDERQVPPDHPESNYGLAYRLLLEHVHVPETQIHRMHGELPASEAGESY